MSSIDTLEARLRAAGARVRAMRALEAAVWGAAVALGIAAIASCARGLLPAQVAPLARGFRALPWLALVPVVAAISAALREVPPLPLLTALDRSHGLRDLLSSAWALSRLPPAQRGAFVELTIVRAERAAGALEVRRSFPWRRPRGLPALAVAIVAAAATWLMPPQPSASARVAPSAPARPLERLVSPAQLARFRERLARIDASGRASTVRKELDRVLDELARGPADRLHVLRRLGELEDVARLMASGVHTSRDAPLAGTRGIASSPGASQPCLPEPTGAPAPRGPTEPLAPQAPAEAAGPAPASGEAAAPTTRPVPPAAAPPPDVPPPRVEAQPPPPQREGEPSPPEPSPPPQSPQSGGQHSSPPAAKEARPVAAAPSQPGNDSAPRGPDLERKRPPRNPERQRAENLADAIAELRDLMRRDQKSVQADLGDPSQAAPPPDHAADPARDDSAGNRPGAPNAAYARGGSPPRVTTENGESAREDVSQLPAAATRVSGARSAGPVRSQVIYGAAQRGFAGSDYARVHAEYEDHAERELEREAIPPGYRGYVRRYFEAIAPRKAP
jgi:hypothetical protein